MKFTTTYVERENTNQKLLWLAGKELYGEGKHSPVKTVEEEYWEKRIKLFGHIIKAPSGVPERDITFLGRAIHRMECSEREMEFRR